MATAFESAIRNLDYNGVLDIIKTGIDVNNAFPADGPFEPSIPLDCAASTGDVKMIEILLSNNADINTLRPTYESSALQSVIGSRRWKDEESERISYFDAAKYLIEKGIDINIQDFHQQTALFTAVDSNDIEIVALLLENGADQNIPDDKGRTPLELSKEYKFNEIESLLLSKIK